MSFKKVTKVIAVFLFVLLIGTSAAIAADKPVLTVGTSTLDEKEVLNLMATTTGGNQMMVGLMLAQSTLPERVDLVNQMAHALLFAEAAKTRGLDSRPDVAFQIKWQTMQILMQAYFEQNASKWDMSEKAVRNYYDTHKDDFYQKPGAHTRHILTQTEGDALNAALEVYKTKDFAKVASEYSRDPNSANNGGDLGWVEKGMMVAPVEAAIDGASVGSLVGPVKSDYGWHIIEVTERRPGRQLTFDESGERAVQGLQREYLENELKELEAKFSVNIDEKALENLGGIPAPAAAQK
ncbi:MAG: peptidylprolyl isomerase [Synergistaceae bacterium]|jgi:peptidyl-prolyl cis-trans isomerase C|nr:peptidylprolyl isomerase [Synergistaceae bacterium]MCK9437778.1 peptidylprolyl isomerase [Synergistaceae bacterium]MDD2350287.1 peptidylprolyl isomerase [Synergistaceae bacterium]MDD3319359.1 peptidylprolyl isomerase [Synergistaceae bacterium]MDD3672037.1 peptidylprolyl isomerase [Synergistaceae bacterium]